MSVSSLVISRASLYFTATKNGRSLMNVSVRNFGIAALCLAATASSLAIPTLASAEPDVGLRIPVGDLAQPDAARDFNHRLQAAADRFCGAHYRPQELAQRMTCLRAIKD